MTQTFVKQCASGGCEVDHLISLELGGSNDIKNLWPEPYEGQCNAHQKDKLENRLHAMVCTGMMSLDTAQKGISSNWIALYSEVFGGSCMVSNEGVK